MILEKLQKDLKEAMKAGEKERLSTLRFLLAALRNRQIEKQADLVDDDVVAVIRQQVKQRKESIVAYQQGNRADLVAKEQSELDLLNTYLPQQMSDEEVVKIVKEVVAEVGATGPGDFGKAMGVVMGKVKGQADGNQVAAMVKKELKIEN